MKYILIIGDGMADDPVEGLGGKTPLQYANIPTMDMLASKGETGFALTVPDGLQPGSDVAILSIFGCDPTENYTGRAPLEAAATGISLSQGDACFRCNMVAIEDIDAPFEEKKILSHSGGSVEGSESDRLILDLFESPVFKHEAEKAGLTAHPASSFRHLASIRATDMTNVILFPPHDHLGEKLKGILPTTEPGALPEQVQTAAKLKELMRLAHEFLDTHPINNKRRAEGKLPANGIWFWAAGSAVALPSFYDKFGKSGGVISAVPLCHGIGVLLGLEKIVVEGATGELDTNYEGKVDAAIEALQRHDFVAVHIEAPDECTHNGDTTGKIQAIELIDSRITAPLLARLEAGGEDFRILLMSDHRTLTSTRGHDGAPVPYLIYDSRHDKNTGASYNEKSLPKDAKTIQGTEVMGRLFRG